MTKDGAENVRLKEVFPLEALKAVVAMTPAGNGRVTDWTPPMETGTASAVLQMEWDSEGDKGWNVSCAMCAGRGVALHSHVLSPCPIRGRRGSRIENP
jgi:hypothetical protein